MPRIFAKYDVSELTEHYYDRPCPACEDCDPNAEKELEECVKCKEFRKWEFSHEQLTFNNWIDVYGPGFWDMNQYDANKMAEDLIEEISKKGFNDALEKSLTNSIITMHRAMLGEGGNSYLSAFFRVDVLLS